VPWQFGHLMKQIADSTTVPILTGEDIYLKEEFVKAHRHGGGGRHPPRLASSGGILETKKIGDYAMEHGVPMAMHFAGTPSLSWRTSTARRPRRTSSPSSTTRWTCRGGAIS